MEFESGAVALTTAMELPYHLQWKPPPNFLGISSEIRRLSLSRRQKRNLSVNLGIPRKSLKQLINNDLQTKVHSLPNEQLFLNFYYKTRHDHANFEIVTGCNRSFRASVKSDSGYVGQKVVTERKQNSISKMLMLANIQIGTTEVPLAFLILFVVGLYGVAFGIYRARKASRQGVPHSNSQSSLLTSTSRPPVKKFQTSGSPAPSAGSGDATSDYTPHAYQLRKTVVKMPLRDSAGGTNDPSESSSSTKHASN